MALAGKLLLSAITIPGNAKDGLRYISIILNTYNSYYIIPTAVYNWLVNHTPFVTNEI